MQNNRFEKACENSAFESLNDNAKRFIKEKSSLYKLTFSQIKQLVTTAIDLQMWGEDISLLWRDEKDKKECLQKLFESYENLKNTPKKYSPSNSPQKKQEMSFKYENKSVIGFGKCPVASEKTRCCNLLTLDVYEGCGFECSYCSIQTFHKNNILAFEDFDKKLSQIELDPNKIYHIGTGQSSDSLMIGNKSGALEALIKFAAKNKNVILEFKSKSDNIDYLLKTDIPKNIICSFSLNPDIVSQNEERFAASLTKRIKAAKALSQKGVLVGFHFHPMIFFDNWAKEYDNIAQELIKSFPPHSVALVSMGTLTFTKPVLRQIRAKAAKTKILQMPLVESCGKYSYPLNIKESMFKTLYQSFKDWQDKVFFYLCMEDKSLWKKTFGYEYESNEEFEEAMKKAYMDKIYAKENNR
jgi:spore photoproduct lyase